MIERIVLILSGGMDSYTLLKWLLGPGGYHRHNIYVLTFDYGQRHSKEIDYAERIALEEDVAEWRRVDMSVIGRTLLGGSSQTDPSIDVPEGHYEEETMKMTVVPNRNMIMLSIATGYAIQVGAHKVFYGAHSGDHAIYPDCRPEFVDAMNQVTTIANWDIVSIVTPFIKFSKGIIAVIGKDLGVDYSKAWTCYNGRGKACGKCGACQERLEAMSFAGIVDPLEYEEGVEK